MNARRVDEDKRRVERIPVRVPIPAEITIAQPARLIEISEVGARIESGVALHLDAIHEVHLDMVGTAAVLRARVVHCHLSEVGSEGAVYSAGVEFLEMPESVGDRLRAYIAGLDRADS